MYNLFDPKNLSKLVKNSNLTPENKAKLLEVLEAYSKNKCLDEKSKAKAMKVLQETVKDDNMGSKGDDLNKIIEKLNNGEPLTSEEMATINSLGKGLKFK